MGKEKKISSQKHKTSQKKYDNDSNAGYFLEVDINYPKTLFDGHKNLPFLPKRKKV